MKSESENLYTNEEELDKPNSNSEQLFTTEHLENTPFTMINQDEKWFGVIGEHRISEMHKTKEELEEDLKQISWNRIVQVLWAINTKINKLTEN